MARQRDRTHRKPRPGERAGMIRGFWTIRSITQTAPEEWSVAGTVMDTLDASTPATFMEFTKLGWYPERVEQPTGIFLFSGGVYYPVTEITLGVGETLLFKEPTATATTGSLLCIPVLSRFLDLANGLQINGGRFQEEPS